MIGSARNAKKYRQKRHKQERSGYKQVWLKITFFMKKLKSKPKGSVENVGENG